MGKMQLVAVFVLILFTSFTWAFDRKTILGYRLGGARKAPPKTEHMFAEQAAVVGADTFSQLISHFGDNNGTWTQHYFYNYQFQQNFQGVTNNAVFLMIGGEGPESSYWSRSYNLPWMKWASANGAAVFDLEHRFYGNSRPFPKQSVENLKYLSSRQAIEDIAFLHSVHQSEKQMDVGEMGALAAWARQKHPELIAGAVGSSGPVQANLDFYQYLQVVENSLNYTGTPNAPGWTFGSPACLAAVKAGYAQVIELMKTVAGRAQLSTQFHLAPTLANTALNYNDIQYFYQNIFGNFQGIVQYSNDQGKNDQSSISAICKIMTANSDPYTALVNVNKALNGQGVYNNYTGDIAYLQDESYGDVDLAAARSWIWQTCTEFGYYQTTDYTQGIFGATSALSLSINYCQDIYGKQFDADYISAAVKATNDFYGGADGYSGTNVVLPNGDLDPWHALGKLQSDFDTQIPFLIEGSAHCGDMYEPELGDKRYDKLYALVSQQIPLWLKGSSEKAIPKQAQKEAMAPSKPAKPFKHTITQLKSTLVVENGHKYRPVSRKVPMLRSRPRVQSPEFDFSKADTNNYTAFLFTQPESHFDQTPNNFSQRWWMNAKWARASGPNFIMIGGEGEANPNKWMLNEDLPFLKWAATYSANVYYMEHRCYGESLLSGSSGMKYCNSWESLWDLRSFITTMNGQGNKGPWITFGGSYSGMLSLWARNKFPDLIQGAVGSSAPVNVKLDFYEYMTVVENSLRMYSSPCADIVGKAFTQMQQLALTPSGLKQLSDLFTLSPAWDENSKVSEIDLQFFFSNIFGNFQGAVQYAGDNAAWYANGDGDIASVCAIMNANVANPLQAVAAVNKYMWQFYSESGDTFSTFNNYTEMIVELRDVSAGADRSWTYQTCNEFGFFQSTDSGVNIFGSPTPVNMYIQMCYDIFGNGNDGNKGQGSDYSTRNIQSDIKNHYNFFTSSFSVSAIVAPNGNVDPWHALGLSKINNGDQTLITINATAHCADMYPERASDPDGLKNARKTIGNLIGHWTAQAHGSGCPNGFSDQNALSICLRAGSGAKSYFSAVAECRSAGGDLLSIHNAFQNNLLAQIQQNMTQSSRGFLGAQQLNGNWFWNDNTPFDYQRFDQSHTCRTDTLRDDRRKGTFTAQRGVPRRGKGDRSAFENKRNFEKLGVNVNDANRIEKRIDGDSYLHEIAPSAQLNRKQWTPDDDRTRHILEQHGDKRLNEGLTPTLKN
ncbi:unnamed protein product, partial [Mesorhabditis belari]|uniref:C-type lectin domain-containing protein n=1 Tax=Mesorhabditis belari TaxID=2138241 RepID=A0AAF3EE94_9BILA